MRAGNHRMYARIIARWLTEINQLIIFSSLFSVICKPSFASQARMIHHVALRNRSIHHPSFRVRIDSWQELYVRLSRRRCVWWWWVVWYQLIGRVPNCTIFVTSTARRDSSTVETLRLSDGRIITSQRNCSPKTKTTHKNSQVCNEFITFHLSRRLSTKKCVFTSSHFALSCYDKFQHCNLHLFFPPFSLPPVKRDEEEIMPIYTHQGNTTLMNGDLLWAKKAQFCVLLGDN